MNTLKSLNLTASFLLELAMIVALSYAGFHTDTSSLLHWVAGLGVPAVVIVFWGKYMAPHASGRFSDSIRLIVALTLFEAAAFTLNMSHQQKLALVMAVTSAINIALAYLWKQ